MNVKEWEKQRQIDLKSGSHYLAASDPIQINMEDNEMLKVIDEYDLTELKERLNEKKDLWFEKMTLKDAIYMDKVKNDTKSITNWLIEKNNDLKKQFPKFFWAEYVADEMYERNYGFEDMINYCGLMGDIYDYLNKHKKAWGMTGEAKQETAYGQKIDAEIEKLTGMSFSWRGWGALMAAFMNTKEKKRKYDYMSFYM